MAALVRIAATPSYFGVDTLMFRMSSTEDVPAVVVGAGSAGLSTSYFLKQQGVEHVVLERGGVGNTWRRERWDSFTLNTPNHWTRMPGSPYRGDEPKEFMARDAIVGFLDEYAREHALPVRQNIEVTRAGRRDDGWLVESSGGDFRCRQLVVAAGAFPIPRMPDGMQQLAKAVHVVHSSGYRNPEALPPGGVLVVGTAQSGVQIAEDLLNAGREVHLCVGSCPRAPRSYRGRDSVEWIDAAGIFDVPVEQLEDPSIRLACNLQIKGRLGGPDLDVRHLASRGAVLHGRFLGADGAAVHLKDDCEASLRKADAQSQGLLDRIDRFIEENGIDAPPPDSAARDFSMPKVDPRTRLDLAEEGIGSVISAAGFGMGFPWLEGCPVDAQGYPVQKRGVTDVPGLSFVGLNFMHTKKSGLLCGVGEDARHVASHVAAALAVKVRP